MLTIKFDRFSGESPQIWLSRYSMMLDSDLRSSWLADIEKLLTEDEFKRIQQKQSSYGIASELVNMAIPTPYTYDNFPLSADINWNILIKAPKCGFSLRIQTTEPVVLVDIDRHLEVSGSIFKVDEYVAALSEPRIKVIKSKDMGFWDESMNLVVASDAFLDDNPDILMRLIMIDGSPIKVSIRSIDGIIPRVKNIRELIDSQNISFALRVHTVDEISI